MSPATGSLAGAAGAFDSVAHDYDRTFSHRILGRWLRSAVHQQIHAHAAGDRVIELGCGTGEDALWLAQRGVQVEALDASAAMLSVTEHKLRRAGVADRVRLEQIDLNGDTNRLRAALAGLASSGDQLFNGCLSNFGVLNCVTSRPALAAAVAAVMRPGARLTAVVMGPVCIWEIAAFALRGQLANAGRRLHGRSPVRIGDQTIVVDYPTPRRLRRELHPWFRATTTRAIGVLLPPSQLAHLVDRRLMLFERLRRWEDRIAHLRPASWLSDHYLLELKRR